MFYLAYIPLTRSLVQWALALAWAVQKGLLRAAAGTGPVAARHVVEIDTREVECPFARVAAQEFAGTLAGVAVVGVAVVHDEQWYDSRRRLALVRVQLPSQGRQAGLESGVLRPVARLERRIPMRRTVTRVLSGELSLTKSHKLALTGRRGAQRWTPQVRGPRGCNACDDAAVRRQM